MATDANELGKLLLGYQSTPPPVKSGDFVYILQGACFPSQTRDIEVEESIV
jgi:hypothetical protein